MKEKVIIIGIKQLDQAIIYLKEAGFDPVHEMVLKPHKAERSVYQNRLVWLWNTEIGEQTGESKEEVHERYKEKFLVNIFERDNEGYAQMIADIRQVWKWGEHEMAKRMHQEIVNQTSTRDATVDQFSEYLGCLEGDARSNGLTLTDPEDLRSYAMKER